MSLKHVLTSVQAGTPVPDQCHCDTLQYLFCVAFSSLKPFCCSAQGLAPIVAVHEMAQTIAKLGCNTNHKHFYIPPSALAGEQPDADSAVAQALATRQLMRDAPLAEEEGALQPDVDCAALSARDQANGSNGSKHQDQPWTKWVKPDVLEGKYVSEDHQYNCAYYSVLGQNPQMYLLARAIQFFTPGVPLVYYVGLLAGTNDLERVAATGNIRDINRHWYSVEEAESAVQQPVVKVSSQP